MMASSDRLRSVPESINHLREDHTLNRMIPANGMDLPTAPGGQ